MIEIFDDRVVISNPGGVPKGINKSKFGKISIARNPNIASLLQRANYIEKMGTGIARITNAMKNAGLPEPKFDIENFFMVTLLRESYINKKNKDSEQDSEQDKLLKFLEKPRTKKEISEFLGIKSLRYLKKKYLEELLNSKKIKMTIPDKQTSKNQKYVVSKFEKK